MTRGRCGSLHHFRMTFSFTTPRRFNRRTRRKTMNATATAMAVEPTPVVDMATKHERYTAPQIEELRQRVQVTGKVIAPVLRSLAEEMFHHGVSNECVREGLQRATGLGLQQDVDECVQKWGIDVN